MATINPKSSIVRIIAVGSALLLVAGFVWYRGTGRLPFAGSGRAENAAEHAAPDVPQEPARRTVMSGSKSLVIAPQESSASTEASGDDEALMSSSKSGAIVKSQDIIHPPAAQTRPEGTDSGRGGPSRPSPTAP